MEYDLVVTFDNDSIVKDTEWEKILTDIRKGKQDFTLLGDSYTACLLESNTGGKYRTSQTILKAVRLHKISSPQKIMESQDIKQEIDILIHRIKDSPHGPNHYGILVSDLVIAKLKEAQYWLEYRR